MNDNSPIIVALDFPTTKEVLAMATHLDPKMCRIKIGFEAFLNGGPQMLDELHHQGFEVFLDLKFHDIPNTVASVCAAAAKLGVWMLNVHASGGSHMLAAAREAVDQQAQQPLLIAVTVLTSTSEKEHAAMGFQSSIAERVEQLAAAAQNAGADGVVCSAMEAKQLRQKSGQDFVLVTPGIRPEGADHQDQSRVMTPAQALANGSSYLVIGRPITQAEDPIAVLDKIHVTICTK